MGFADANNFGIKRTGFVSDFTVFLNQDTVSSRGWIDSCLDCFRRDPKLGVLSPGLRTYDLTDWEQNLVACVRESGLPESTLETEADKIVKVHQVTAAAMMIRTDVLHQVGPFDPIFGSYYEDYDLCRRIRNAGYTIGVCPSARVGHFSGSVTSTANAERRRARTLIRNRLIHKVRATNGGRLRVLAEHLCCTFPRNLTRGLLRTKSSQPISATLAAHWDLMKIADRLLSEKRDESLWQQYLQSFRTPDFERSSN